MYLQSLPKYHKEQISSFKSQSRFHILHIYVDLEDTEDWDR